MKLGPIIATRGPRGALDVCLLFSRWMGHMLIEDEGIRVTWGPWPTGARKSWGRTWRST